MEKKYMMALSETYELFKIMPNDIIEKIPQQLINIIENERDKSYIPQIKQPLNTNNFQYETVVLLGLIYRDFLASEDEKK